MPANFTSLSEIMCSCPENYTGERCEWCELMLPLLLCVLHIVCSHAHMHLTLVHIDLLYNVMQIYFGLRGSVYENHANIL